MGIFDKKQELSREEFKRYLKRPADYLAKGRLYRYSPMERLRIEKEIFGSPEKTTISKEEYDKALRKFSVQRFRAGDERQRAEIGKKLGLLKRLRGPR